ncbi:MAG: metal-dependent hydrolase [Flavobacteriaceae bacterium]|nr:MAG: metal-dependent hydrolase [Flavobacteriaceae bacterium]
MNTLEKLRYPIGTPNIPKTITAANVKNWTSIISNFPEKLRLLTLHLSEDQLNTVYRKDGWTIRQVIHHCYDSHHNSYTRFKWALTEDEPVIKTYNEKKWAALFDTKQAPIQLSINGLQALHAKWVYLLEGMTPNDFKKTFVHPDGNEHVSLAENTGIYAWHCEHHFAHIFLLLQKKQWV